MREFLRRYLASTVYVRVRRNRFRLRHLESGRELAVDGKRPFSTERLLVGDFEAAQETLKQALRQAAGGGLFAVSPRVVIQPLESIEGGLSEIEERVLRELASGAGARQVAVWVGPELDDAQVREKLLQRR
jgi:rod shape-determining protein MreB